MPERYNPVEVEHRILKLWKELDIPRRVREASYNRDTEWFTFLEGPPTTNGFMHVGHARGRALKDVVIRYKRMRGFRVWDQAGWDTQGLPVELEVEKKLGFSTKKDIESYGIDRFIKECNQLVDYYLERWVKDSIRLGLWLNYDIAYETRHPRYIEVEWQYLKAMWEKGWLYQDLRVVPVCPRCETALSSHEVALGYKEVEDPSVHVKFPLEDRPNEYLIAWTTTPWTLIANEALTVSPNNLYARIKVGEEKWIVAKPLLDKFVADVGLSDYEIEDVFLGESLVGQKYRHPLVEEVPAHANHNEPYDHRVVSADWVSMEEGTGVVHTAPAHGPEDFEVARQFGVTVFNPLAKNGFFTQEAGKYAGMYFEEAGKQVIEDLKRKGLLVHSSTYVHEYPFCWRCDTPLMYYADKQWFIRVAGIKETMVNENRAVDWHPDWASHRFGDWLENARDWCISRERYWGTPLPIWTCKSCEHRVVVGSLNELKKIAIDPSKVPEDPHRPWIDQVELKCPECGGVMAREPYVVDVWMDSGVAHTAGLAQYGLEGRFGEYYPFDFITEALDQTRGWFYTLMFTGASWYGKSPYKCVLNQGHVLDKFGKKMSKSRGNVINAIDAFESWGADVYRLYVLAKSPAWENINFDPDETKVYRRVLDILWNSVGFALMYMPLDNFTAEKVDEGLKHLELEDKWLLTKLQRTIEGVTREMEEVDTHTAARMVSDFIVETLSHKYISLIRRRVWEEADSPKKLSAYATLYIALTEVLKLIAPFTPFIAEELHQKFVRKLDPSAPESVHFCKWPTPKPELIFEREERAMDLAFEVEEAALALRNKHKVKRRWPLRKAVVVAPSEDVAELVAEASEQLKEMLNVKEVLATTSYGPSPTEDVIELRSGLRLFLNVVRDEELMAEAYAKELIRRIQVVRKELDLPVEAVVKSVKVAVDDPEISDAVSKHIDFIKYEVRAEAIECLPLAELSEGKEFDVDGRKVRIAIEQ